MTNDHPALPPPASRPWIACAVATIIAVGAAGLGNSGLAVASLLVVGLAFCRQMVSAGIVAVACLHALLTAGPLDPLVPGPFEGRGAMMSDVIEGRYGPYILIDLTQGTVLADLPDTLDASRGDLVEIEGVVVGDPGTVGGRRHRGTVEVDRIDVLAGPGSPVMAVGNIIRDRVSRRLEPRTDGRALLAGFLVGDTGGVEDLDESAMRRAGLSHFTAVSGSNVAVYLGLLYIAVGPLGVGPKRRAVLGLLGLPVFAAATRFEPSVLRASAMAGLVLGGRLFGIALETWQVLSAAVIGLLLIDPALVGHSGFQLSVAATAGVIVGSRWPVDGRLGRALAVSVGAQIGVAPLLLLHFGSLPLLSPLANLVAAPLVAVSTVLGVVGVVGPAPVIDLAAWLAGLVLGLARVAAGWPQVGWTGLAVAVAVGLLFLTIPRWRGPIALVGAVVLAVVIAGPARHVPDPGVVVLDVGQGDAILLAGGGGRFALVDGGPDPIELVESLSGYGVTALELVVLTHVHADHATGLIGLAGMLPVGRVWAATPPHESEASEQLFSRLAESGTEVSEPSIRTVYDLGDLDIRVEGPLRRYASPNDQSIVLMVTGPTRSMLLAGDIETIAQAELGHLRADVLKVPHQGAATSDPDWLTGVGADLAVISVGPNQFGHPAEWVIDTLEESGATVFRTDEVGDVAVPLG